MKIDNILKASLCAFGQNTFDSYSLEEEEFIRALDYFINENDFNSMIEDYAYEFDYDIDDLKKAEQRINCKSKDFEYSYKLDKLDEPNTPREKLESVVYQIKRVFVKEDNVSDENTKD